MNQNENNFADLKRLLKVKRHEVPPPGYFNGFSDQVVSRLRAGEAHQARSLMEQLEVEAPWLVNFLRIFETRPGLIGGFATSLCLLLLLFVVFSDHSNIASKNLLTVSDPAMATDNSVAAINVSPLLPAPGAAGIVASTNPVTSLQPASTLFGQAGGSPLFQPASFAPNGQ